MNIERYTDIENGEYHLHITLPMDFINHECEPYGDAELCKLITHEQGMQIIMDAILMAMHLKLKNPDTNPNIEASRARL